MQMDLDTGSVLIALLSLLLTAIGVYFTYQQLRRTPKNKNANQHIEKASSSNKTPNYWDSIRPNNSKYTTVETFEYLPRSIQTVVIEYGTQGHTHALNLKGMLVRAEISFDSKIVDPIRAIRIGGKEHPLNYLPVHFIMKARNILEKYSFDNLQENRSTIAKEIFQNLQNHFTKYGVTLVDVQIGALTKIAQ